MHAQATSELSLYLSGNRLYNPATATWYPTSIGSQYSAPFYNDNSHPLTQLSADPHAKSGGSTWKAWSYSTLQAKLVALAGKSPALRDPIDAALFAEVQSGGGDFLDEMDLSSSDPWAPVDVVNTRSFTTPANAETDSDGDGYTLLEETLHDYAYKIQGSPRVSVSDTFEDGNFTGWHTDGGSSNFQIATDGSYVLAQLDTSADAQAFLADSAFYEQTVRTKVKPVSFNGSNRFVRVYARYQDPENAYYVALRSTGVIELKKLHYGTVTTLDAVNTLPISVGVWYDVRLEVSPGIPGAPTTLKAVVKNLANSQSVTLQASDNNPLPPGFAAVGTYFASARFDDVFVDPTAGGTVLDDFEDRDANGWTPSGGTWAVDSATKTYRQTNTGTSVNARSSHAANSSDHSIQADVCPLDFRSTSGSVMLCVRYTDASHAYFLTIGESGNAVLKKANGGSSVVIAGPVASGLSEGQWCVMKLEAEGSSIRGYVNGQLLVQATDSTISTGDVALGTYATTAAFDDVSISDL